MRIGILGNHGAGKSTQIDLVKGYVRQLGYQVELVNMASPGRSAARRIAAAHGQVQPEHLFAAPGLALVGALDGLRRLAEAHMGATDRTVLLFDKYVDAFRALCAATGVADLTDIDHVFAWYPRLDLKIFLQVPVSESLRRIKLRNTAAHVREEPEELATYLRQYETMLSADPDVVMIDGTQDQATVFGEIQRAVKPLLAGFAMSATYGG